MRTQHERFEVSDSVSAGERIEMAATIFRPDAESRPAAVIFALPGAGYGRGYFDMAFPGREGYSQAEFHTARGATLIAMDMVGAGESTVPGDHSLSELPAIAAAYDAAVRQALASIGVDRTGSARDPLAVPVVGFGQSLGGAVTIVTQSQHETFDAIANCGFSAIQVVMPQRCGSPAAIDVAEFDFRYAFHWDDEPDDVVAADLGGGYPRRTAVPPFGSASHPGCVATISAAGVIADDARRVSVPVLLATGERDMCAEPMIEAGAYRSSRDVTSVVIPRMAHMHNFANTRHLLWRRFDSWLAGLPAALRP